MVSTFVGAFGSSNVLGNHNPVAPPSMANQLLQLGRKVTKLIMSKVNLCKNDASETKSSSDVKIIELPNFKTAHINQHGEAFYLTPIGGNAISDYDPKHLDSYTKNCMMIRIKKYNESGNLICDGKIIDHSLVEKIDKSEIKEYVVNLWIQACHFIVVKSNQGRYWFLHYDPGQAKFQQNEIDGWLDYPRPNYSDLKPILPYDVASVALEENEKVQVLVVHPNREYDIDDPTNLSNGEFDFRAFKRIVGEDKVASIKMICCKDFTNIDNDIDLEIKFSTKNNGIEIFVKDQCDKPIYKEDNLFQDGESGFIRPR
jgi:translation initiation factor 2 beta subunit (eIF-2beta)/eIF-5